jgi:hypothetical protein
MGKYTQIPANTFNALQLDAGVILSNFNPANPNMQNSDIISATTGGITITAAPTFSDLGEDVDNVPVNMKELKHLDSWEMTIATSVLNNDLATIALAFGCADIDTTNSKIIPRKDLKQSDFKTIWFVGDRADGGCIAVKLKNALSTAGYALTTSKNGKGTSAITLTGHVSINAQNEMPMEVYVLDPATYTVTQTLSHVTSSFTDTSIVEGETLTATLTAAEGYTISDAPTVTMGGETVTGAWNSSTSTVTIDNVSGAVVISCSGTESTGA